MKTAAVEQGDLGVIAQAYGLSSVGTPQPVERGVEPSISNLTTPQGDFVLRRYSIGGGIKNDVFKLHTPQGDFVLKRYTPEHKSEGEIDNEHGVLQHLLKKDFKSFARPLVADLDSVDGDVEHYRGIETVVRIGENIYALFEQAEGAYATGNDIKPCVEALADYHLAISDYDAQKRVAIPGSVRSRELRSLSAALADSEPTGVIPEIGLHLGMLKQHLYALESKAQESGLPTLVCHNDYQSTNIIVDGNTAKFIDFEEAARLYRLQEFIVCTNLFGYNKRGNFGFKRLKRISAGYQERNPLTQEEIELFPDFFGIQAAYAFRDVLRIYERGEGIALETMLEDPKRAKWIEKDFRNAIAILEWSKINRARLTQAVSIKKD
ncbi:phosphotransferase [Candidatus Woesearchaeota archaeon]|nr:phosphotransferase [Candidatus Woesearchaeota archaeon]